MTTYSLSDLATRSLRKAGLISPEETTQAQDLDYAQEGIESDVAALAFDGINILNGSLDAIPLEYLEPLAEYHALTFKKDYGLIGDAECFQAQDFVKKRLRRLSAKQANGSVQEAEYF